MNVDEAFDVGAAQLLVRAREPRQLAQVRVAAPPVPLREHGEVVVVRGDDLLAEPLERLARRRRGEPLVALLERAHEPLVRRPESASGSERSMPVYSGRFPACRRIRTSASFERPTNGDASTVDERLVVVAVVQQPQVAQQVDDLLLAEVPAAGRAVGRQPGAAQRRLVALRVGARREQQHDLAGRRRAGVDELADAARDRLRFALAPVRSGVAVAALVADEQLDRMAEDRVGELARRGERLVVRRRTPR